jgi:pyruvate dehydrogenase (quinone)
MAKKTVGELLVETLIAAGVKRVFGLAGDSLNGVTDCKRKGWLLRRSRMRYAKS